LLRELAQKVSYTNEENDVARVRDAVRIDTGPQRVFDVRQTVGGRR